LSAVLEGVVAQPDNSRPAAAAAAAKRAERLIAERRVIDISGEQEGGAINRSGADADGDNSSGRR
jgi:hypothetical protein